MKSVKNHRTTLESLGGQDRGSMSGQRIKGLSRECSWRRDTHGLPDPALNMLAEHGSKSLDRTH